MLIQRNKNTDSAGLLKIYCLLYTSTALRFTFNMGLLNDLQVYLYHDEGFYCISFSLGYIILCIYQCCKHKIEKCLVCDKDKCQLEKLLEMLVLNLSSYFYKALIQEPSIKCFTLPNSIS